MEAGFRVSFWAKNSVLDAPFLTNRKFVEGVIWIGKNGVKMALFAWEYGKGGSVHKRFKHWSDNGIWQMIFNTLVEDAEMEWVMSDCYPLIDSMKTDALLTDKVI